MVAWQYTHTIAGWYCDFERQEGQQDTKLWLVHNRIYLGLCPSFHRYIVGMRINTWWLKQECVAFETTFLSQFCQRTITSVVLIVCSD